jgi:hypothetical protein
MELPHFAQIPAGDRALFGTNGARRQSVLSPASPCFVIGQKNPWNSGSQATRLHRCAAAFGGRHTSQIRREFGFDLALACVDDNIEAGVRGAKLW